MTIQFDMRRPIKPSISKPINKSSKLADVFYDIRGPVLELAQRMEEEGQSIMKLNIGNLASFGFEPPDEIVQDMIRNLPHTAGYTDSKGLYAPRRAVVNYCQEKQIQGVTVDDVYLGNGASELITMSLNALLDSGDEILVPAPDYPLWTGAVSLSGGRPVHYICDEAKRVAARSRGHPSKDNAADTRHRGNKSQQSDWGIISGRHSSRDRRNCPRTSVDRFRR